MTWVELKHLLQILPVVKANFEALLDAISFNNSSNGTLSEAGRAFSIDVTDTAGGSTA